MTTDDANTSLKRLPERTIERLSEYRRMLLECLKQGRTHIYSHELASMHGITAVQVRRDLMLIGFSSDTKKGYDVEVLIEFIGTILDSPDGLNVGIIGMGNLAQAVTHYFNGKRSKLRITAAFDIDPQKVGHTVAGVPCFHMESFAEEALKHDLRVVILTSPSSVAPEMVEPITQAGIRGVLNFTSTPLNFPEDVYVEDYDIITLLEKVAYFSK
ncbi:MAG TPA: redox-sensing transcriptional repressor Rex [Candidatus Rikenella faecigallinarum]|uniref:Redox-sensing transcriptional repressor Rex n=1 Tax=Candidatus Rikenella faecigallinarum TaxID=2838745 RepID=A0A9D1QDQ2_9BACT|nr:redox-sensing transcriptional repressor Rex [Candidatus Rikenella faecigallinarum]